MVDVPIRDRRAERHAATRAEILDAAWAQVRDEGLAALSLRDLAATVGMRAPSLYSYFDSKFAIYDAMFAQGAQEFLDASLFREPPTGDPLTDLRSGMHSFMDFCTANPARYQLLFQRTIPGFEPSEDAFALSVKGLELTRERLVDVGITRGEDLDLFTAIGTGLTDQQISNDPGGERWSRLVDDAMEMFLTHVTSRAEQPREEGTTS